ncbi:hypothetical protein SGLAD_v1c05130 [Spiroplasma gladiatoris]|uniref:Uncharacterized protein n=1 Tax=Spiroplasma gladiatoris TaxID=2143 RepID=A0A4P7AHN3_9MOLU|nr:hypothetical protein [Spiroplasma gladiatoris]QBQ07712.1 hypothetical protein SGLAD_v1c05130 [Spiroplasma gladiatoris]
MPQFSPKFCPIHLKIHVCDNQDISKKIIEIEGDLGAKVRRLHGTQTEEEIALEAKKRKKHQNAPGSLGDILAKAKAKVAAEKAKFAQDNKDDINEDNTISEAEIGDRMAALRAKAMSGGTQTTSELNEHIPPIDQSETSGISKIIDKAKQHQKENFSCEYKVPERSKTGEKKDNSTKEVKKYDDFFEVNEDTELNQSNNDLLESKNQGEKLFTYEETHELIQSAVEKALEQVGIVKPKSSPKPRKKTTKE